MSSSSKILIPWFSKDKMCNWDYLILKKTYFGKGILDFTSNLEDMLNLFATFLMFTKYMKNMLVDMAY